MNRLDSIEETQLRKGVPDCFDRVKFVCQIWGDYAKRLRNQYL